MVKLRKPLLAFLVGASALATWGCPNLLAAYVLQIDMENPSPRVGESTTIRLEVQAPWLITPTFYYKALRGRIVGSNGETGPQGGYVRASNTVKYYAPYTSSYYSAGGIQQSDQLDVMVQSGTSVTHTPKVIPITGSTVVFSTQTATTGVQSTQNGNLMIATDTGNGQQQTQPQPLLNLAGQQITGISPVISPLGDKIAYVYFPGDGSSKIMMRDTSGQVTALTNNSGGLCLDPAWSPDGQYLLFASNNTSDGNFEIYLENVDNTEGGRSVTRLTNNNWDERHPSWNPVASVASMNLPVTTTGSQLGSPQVTGQVQGMFAVTARKNTLSSPGGRAQNWNVFLMDRNGNYVRSISDLQGDGTNWAVEPCWRPDGQAIAYTRFGPVANYQSDAAKFQRIYVQELAQSQTVTPLNAANTDPNSHESTPIWGLNGQNTIYFLRTDGNYQQYARVYQTQYLPGASSNQYPPQLIGAFQSLSLPLTVVASTNRDISGFHPFDWR